MLRASSSIILAEFPATSQKMLQVLGSSAACERTSALSSRLPLWREKHVPSPCEDMFNQFS
jgi:hypothetical protein